MATSMSTPISSASSSCSSSSSSSFLRPIASEASRVFHPVYPRHPRSRPSSFTSCVSVPPVPPLSESDFALLRSQVLPLPDLFSSNFSVIKQAIGDARVVLIGEATHGTEEFYRIRCDIARMLIEECGFDFVCSEADWPDMYRVNRYVNGKGKDRTASQALSDFHRFPADMWRNEAMKEFIEWMKEYNEKQEEKYNRTMDVEAERQHETKDAAAGVESGTGSGFGTGTGNGTGVGAGIASGGGTESSSSRSGSSLRARPPKVGIFGMDLYSLFRSADEVIRYLDNIDPPAAERARHRYSRLFQFRDEGSEYGSMVSTNLSRSQEDQVRNQLLELLRKDVEYLKKDGFADGDELFYTKLNAMVVKEAENYYRNFWSGGATTWNIRDAHMVETVLALMKYYSDRKLEFLAKLEPGEASTRALKSSDKSTVSQVLKSTTFTGDIAKCIIFAHNSHVGDARQTRKSHQDEWNVGQLIRQKLGIEASYIIGFTTNDGTVTAAERWGGSRNVMNVNPGLKEGYECVFHNLSWRMEQEERHKREQSEQEKSHQPKELHTDSNHSSPSPSSSLYFSSTLPLSRRDFSIPFRSNTADVFVNPDVIRLLSPIRLERFIGVQYVKRTERGSHYLPCCLTKQFDYLIHVDTTAALLSLPIPTIEKHGEEEEAQGKEEAFERHEREEVAKKKRL